MWCEWDFKSLKFRQQQIWNLPLNNFDLISDDEWEKDLAAEIQDFEVVDDHNVDESELDDLK